MKILVTGAAGFIGSHLAERLLVMGHEVVGVDCLTDYYARSLKELNLLHLKNNGVMFSTGDLSVVNLADLVEGVEVLYHLAAQPGISSTTSFQTYVNNNIIATQRLVQATQASNTLKCFVNVATSSVYGADATGSESSELKPTSYYGVTKLAAEQIVLSHFRDHGFPACSLRLFSVYGPRERPEKLYPQLIRCILEERDFPLFEGSEHHLRSFTFVGDIIDGLVAVLGNIERCYGEVFNIGTDTAITTAEGVRIVQEIIGKEARIVRKPRRSGDQLRTHANIEKARCLLGYEPRTTPRQGLEQEVRWFADNILGKVFY